MDKIKIGKKILKIINIVGNNTFEIYLIHILLFGMYNVYNFCGKLTLLLLIYHQQSYSNITINL